MHISGLNKSYHVQRLAMSQSPSPGQRTKSPLELQSDVSNVKSVDKQKLAATCTDLKVHSSLHHLSRMLETLHTSSNFWNAMKYDIRDSLIGKLWCTSSYMILLGKILSSTTTYLCIYIIFASVKPLNRCQLKKRQGRGEKGDINKSHRACQ